MTRISIGLIIAGALNTTALIVLICLLLKHKKPQTIIKPFVFWSLATIAVVIALLPFIVHSEGPDIPSEITADGALEYIIGALSFASTLILSSLAIWQTKQMSDMNVRANDLNVITKVVDFETTRMQMIEEKSNAFINICSADSISAVVLLPSPQRITELRKLATDSTTISMSLKRLLNALPYCKFNVKEINMKIDEIENYMTKLAGNDLSHKILSDVLDEAHNKIPSFDASISTLISEITSRIQKCMYDTISLEEVQKLFSDE